MTKLMRPVLFRNMEGNPPHRGFSSKKNCASLLPALNSRSRIALKHIALLTLAVLCLSTMAWSQSTLARLTGKISDSSGAVVPQAHVTIEMLAPT